MVCEANRYSATDIRIRFNNLYRQFLKNQKYMSLDLRKTNYAIPEDEDISYEMLVNKKRYEATALSFTRKKEHTCPYPKTEEFGL